MEGLIGRASCAREDSRVRDVVHGRRKRCGAILPDRDTVEYIGTGTTSHVMHDAKEMVLV